MLRLCLFGLGLALFIPLNATASECPSEGFALTALKKFNEPDLALATTMALIAERQRPFSPMPPTILVASNPQDYSRVARLLLQAAVISALAATALAFVFLVWRLFQPVARTKAIFMMVLAMLLLTVVLQLYIASWDRVVSQGTLSARVLPEPGAASIGAIAGGSIGERLQRQGGYALVDFAGVRGWVIETQLFTVDEWAKTCE